MEQSTAQTIVKVFAILSWIGAAFAVLVGIASFVAGPVIFSMYGAGEDALFGSIFSGFIAALGVILILYGVLAFFIGRGLWRHQNWARIVLLVFAVLGVLSVFSRGFLSAIIGALEIWLFGFEKTVVGLFNAKPLMAKK